MNNIYQERLVNYVASIFNDPGKFTRDITASEEMVSCAEDVFAPGLPELWLNSFGPEFSLKMAFLFGAAWQRELERMRLEHLEEIL